MGNDNTSIESTRLKELKDLEGALRASGNDVPDTLKLDINNLEKLVQIQEGFSGNESTDSDKKQAQQQQIAAMVQAGVSINIARNHVSLVENGFNSRDDFFNFTDNLYDEEYYEYLKNNPEEEKKLKDNIVQAVNNNTISKEDVREQYENNPNFRAFADKSGLSAELGINSEIEKIMDPLKKLGGEEQAKETMVTNNLYLESKRNVVEGKIDINEHDKIREEALSNTLRLQEVVFDNADELKIDNNRQKSEEIKEKDIANLFNKDSDINKLAQTMQSGSKVVSDSSPKPNELNEENSKPSQQKNGDIQIG